MRLLTHNTLRNNSAEAKGKGFPLRIAALEVRVDEDGGQIDEKNLLFVKSLLPILDWPALVQATMEVGIPTLPPMLTDELASDEDFLSALYHVLMGIHVVVGTLTCPVTGKVFPIENEIPNFVLQEDECEAVRY